MHVKTDCKYFKGDIPCVYHKKEGVKCNDSCKYYYPKINKKMKKRILIIKLGAIGDIIRTTPILRQLDK